MPLTYIFLFLCLYFQSSIAAVPVPSSGKSVPAVEKVVNVNTATLAQLESLRGIGPKKAELIIKYRTKNGFFKNVQGLARVPGIGEKFLERLLHNNAARIIAQLPG